MTQALLRSKGAPTRAKSGFTLIELLVVIAIIAILAAILFPVFAKARENARKANCTSNLRQIGMGSVMYAQDYDEVYPGTWQWSPISIYLHAPYILGISLTWDEAQKACQLGPYVKNTGVFVCPSHRIDASYGYAYPTMWRSVAASTPIGFWPTGPTLAELTNPSGTVMAMDSGYWPGTALTDLYSGYDLQYGYVYVYKPFTNPWSAPLPIHNQMVAVAFIDGHVKAMRPEATVSPEDMWN